MSKGLILHKVRPGHYMVCQSFEHIEHRQYWDMEYADKVTIFTVLATTQLTPCSEFQIRESQSKL